MAALTAAVTIALLVPLYRSRAGGAAVSGADAAGAELAIYRDQLDEISRDVKRGVLPASEADAARTEISRRLLKAGDQAEPVPVRPTSAARVVAVVAIVAVPVVSAGAYLFAGSPGWPDMPLAERSADSPTPYDILNIERSFQAYITGQSESPNLLPALEGAIARFPDSAQLLFWQSVVLARENRLDESGTIYVRAMAIDSDVDPQGLIGRTIGPEIVRRNQGVTDIARAVFETVLEVAPDDVIARIYLAGRLSEEGKTSEALAAWRAILELEPPGGAEWSTLVRGELKRLDPDGELPPVPAAIEAPPAGAEPEVAGAPGGIAPAAREPGPSEQEMAAAAELTPEAREEMVGAMVDRLAARLESEPNDPAGWARLIRSYMVLGRTEDAHGALVKARTALAGQPDALARIEAEAGELGVN
jgi:cytochrome c-type biogenesis protein CcmH